MGAPIDEYKIELERTLYVLSKECTKTEVENTFEMIKKHTDTAKKVRGILYAKHKRFPYNIESCPFCGTSKTFFLDPQHSSSASILKCYRVDCSVCGTRMSISFSYKKINAIASKIGAPTWREAKDDSNKMKLRINLIVEAWDIYCKNYGTLSCMKCGASSENIKIIPDSFCSPL